MAIINSALNTMPLTPTGANGQATQVGNVTAAQAGDPTKWNVDDNQTVQGRIQGIIAENSPLMQQAAGTAQQQANDRGLLNSSMAVQSGQAAVYQAALPIAQADAATYAKSAGYNADAANNFTLNNVKAQNDVGLANADAMTKGLLSNAQNQAALTANERDNATRLQTAQMDNSTKLQVQQMQGEYQKLFTTSQEARALYEGMNAKITQINTSNLDQASKDRAIQALYNDTRTGLNTLSTINNIPSIYDYFTVEPMANMGAPAASIPPVSGYYPGGLNSNGGYGQDGSCFVAGSRVLMANGREKPIELIQVGEAVWSVDGPVTVQGLYQPRLGKRPLLSFDNGKCATSAEHAIWTRCGGAQWWSTRDMAQWQHEAATGAGPDFGGLPPYDYSNQLDTPHEFAHVDGWKMHTSRVLDAPADTQLYHLLVDGAQSYFVDGYLVSSMADVDTFDWMRFKWSGLSLWRRAVWFVKGLLK